MKITLDISKLVEEGKLTREEADKLRQPSLEHGSNLTSPRISLKTVAQHLSLSKPIDLMMLV
jgi:hypothetical protein